jgi:3-phosphoshikimate 1-carboxyvinyltransferase
VQPFRVTKKKRLKGSFSAPGDKSISHRAAILASLTSGKSLISNFLPSDDCLRSVSCMRAMGANLIVRRSTTNGWELEALGVGLHGLQEPRWVLDVGNSGTSIRLLSGVLAGQDFFSVITGDDSIRRRPMDRIAAPLTMMGARIDGRDGGKLAPLSIRGAKLRAIEYETPIPSAQVKSSILLAGLFADGVTTVFEKIRSRDHTERMLSAAGADIAVDGLSTSVRPAERLVGRDFSAPGDISSAAFFIVAGLICAESEILIENVGTNPTRTGILRVLGRMGAAIELINEREEGGEPAADILTRTSTLRGTEVAPEEIPTMPDEIPILAVAASFAEGRTVVRGAADLRTKESDRLATTTLELNKMGAKIEQTEDGLEIEGTGHLQGAACRCHGDHRIAMSCAIAGLASEGETTIEGFDCVNTSFPDFEATLRHLCKDSA